MKTTWIKLVVAMALVFLVVFWGIIFWPNETEPEDTPGELKTPPHVQQTRVENLYQMALSHRERDNPSDMDFRITADCCRKILKDYPNTPQAEKANELLQGVPERYQRLAAQTPSQPAVRKSRPLRRRLPRRDDELYITTYEELKSSN